MNSGKPDISEDPCGSGGGETSLGHLALQLAAHSPVTEDSLWLSASAAGAHLLHPLDPFWAPTHFP